MSGERSVGCGRITYATTQLCMMSVYARECYTRYALCNWCAMPASTSSPRARLSFASPCISFPGVEKRIRGSPSATMFQPLMQMPASTRSSFCFFVAGYRLPQIAPSAIPPIPLCGLRFPIMSYYPHPHFLSSISYYPRVLSYF